MITFRRRYAERLSLSPGSGPRPDPGSDDEWWMRQWDRNYEMSRGAPGWWDEDIPCDFCGSVITRLRLRHTRGGIRSQEDVAICRALSIYHCRVS